MATVEKIDRIIGELARRTETGELTWKHGHSDLTKALADGRPPDMASAELRTARGVFRITLRGRDDLRINDCRVQSPGITRLRMAINKTRRSPADILYDVLFVNPDPKDLSS